MVRLSQVNLQRKRTATLNLSRIFQEGEAAIALAQEPYFHKGDFYCGRLLNLTFVAFNNRGVKCLNKRGVKCPREMPQACIQVNSAVEACLLPELITRDICTVVDNLGIGNSTKKYVFCSVYLPHGEPAPTEEFN